MEHPSQLEKNLEGLLVEIGVQKSLREEMKRRGRRGTDSCLQKLEDKERELDDIQKELCVLKTGFHPNKFNARLNLNKRVIEILKVVEELKESKTEELPEEDCTDEPDSVETFIMEQERGKPRRYSYEKLMLSLHSNYTIGEGGFGKVYKGKIDGIEVAIKVLKENAGDVVNKQFTSEVRTVFSTSHRHLVKLLGFCFHPKMKALVYEYMENGSLDKILYKNNPSMHWETLFDIAIGTGKGIAYLHESCDMPMIHFDIKAANVLLDSKHSPKLTDFGLSKMYKKDSDHVSQSKSIGTHGYAAPEVCLGQRVLTYKCDIYSYGMLLFEVLRRKQIRVDEDWYPGQVWRCFSNGELDRLITNCGIEKKNKKKAITLCKAALWCTQVNPDNRPPMSTVVKVLEDAMDLSSPINPDPNNFLSSTSSPSSEVPRSLPSEAVSPAFWSPVESLFGMEESSRHKKFASASDMRTPVYLKENTTRIESSKSTPDILPSLLNDLEDRFEKVSISPKPGSSKETELEVLGMHDRKIYKGKLEDETPRNRNVQSQKKMTHTEKASNFTITAEAIPSIQKEPKEHYKNASSSIKTRSSKDIDSEAMLEQFEMRCPPGGENSVIVYTTTYPYGKPLQDTNQVLLRLHGEKIQYEKRDIHADSRYQNELKTVLGKINLQVPVVFVKGRLIGGAGELDWMYDNGVLETLFHGIPKMQRNEDDEDEENKVQDKEVQKDLKETFKNVSDLPNTGSEKERDSETMLEQFEIRCPPGGENSVIVYTTTYPYGKPLQDTNQVLLHLHGAGIQFEKRDIHTDSRYRNELQWILGKINIQVPVVFVKGRLIGGASELDQMYDSGVLEILFHGIPKKYREEDDCKEDYDKEDISKEDDSEDGIWGTLFHGIPNMHRKEDDHEEENKGQEEKVQKNLKETFENVSNLPNTKSEKERDSEVMLEHFRKRCPPGGENSVIVYTTTNPFGKPLQDTNQVLLRLHGVKIKFEKRDIHAHPRYAAELKRVLGKINRQVPVVFVKGRLVGGASELDQMYDSGVLETLFDGIPKRYSKEDGSKEDDSEEDDSKEEEKEVQREIKETSKNVSNLANTRTSKRERVFGAMLKKVGRSSRGENSVTYKTTTSHTKPSQNTSQIRLFVNGEEVHF